MINIVIVAWNYYPINTIMIICSRLHIQNTFLFEIIDDPLPPNQNIADTWSCERVDLLQKFAGG